MVKLWHVSWKRVLGALAIAFAILWLAGRGLERMEPWIEGRQMQCDNPALSAVPISLPDPKLARLTGDEIQFFGVSMQTPWTWAQTVNSKMRAGRR